MAVLQQPKTNTVLCWHLLFIFADKNHFYLRNEVNTAAKWQTWCFSLKTDSRKNITMENISFNTMEKGQLRFSPLLWTCTTWLFHFLSYSVWAFKGQRQNQNSIDLQGNNKVKFILNSILDSPEYNIYTVSSSHLYSPGCRVFINPICFLNFNACSRDYLNIFFTLFYIFWAMAHSFFFNSMVHNKLKIIWNNALQSNKDNIASQSIDTRIVIYTMRCTQSWYPGKNWRKIGSLSFKSTVIPQQNGNNFLLINEEKLDNC